MRILSDARMAGGLYLLVVLTGMFSLAYVPSQIVVSGDPLATIARIGTMEPLFRAGIAASILCYLAFLLLPLPLHRLLSPYGRVAAHLMVLFAVISVPMALLNLTHRLDVLEARAVGDTARAVAAFAAYGNGLRLVQLFWGLWLLPLGWLIVRSAAIPRLLGVLLIVGGCVYVARVFGGVMMPGFGDLPGLRYASIPGSIGEIGTCLWLLIAGARTSLPAPVAAAMS